MRRRYAHCRRTCGVTQGRWSESRETSIAKKGWAQVLTPFSFRASARCPPSGVDTVAGYKAQHPGLDQGQQFRELFHVTGQNNHLLDDHHVAPPTANGVEKLCAYTGLLATGVAARAEMSRRVRAPSHGSPLLDAIWRHRTSCSSRRCLLEERANRVMRFMYGLEVECAAARVSYRHQASESGWCYSPWVRRAACQQATAGGNPQPATTSRSG